MRSNWLVYLSICVISIAIISTTGWAAETGKGTFKKKKLKSDAADVQNSTDTQEVALSSTVTLNANSAGCILARFSADAALLEAGAVSSAPQMIVIGKLDGAIMNPGPSYLVLADDGSFWSHIYGEWWECGLEGNGTKYKVEVMYGRSNSAIDDTVYLRFRNLVIEYNK